MDIIEKYYSRPSYLDRLTILQFYSMYHISNVTDDKELENLIEPPDKNIIERPEKVFFIQVIKYQMQRG